MNLSLLGIGAVVVAAGALTLGPATPAPFMGSIYEDVADRTTPPAALEQVVLSVPADAPLELVIGLIRNGADRGVKVWWHELNDIGIEADTPTGLKFSEITLPDLLEAVAESLSTDDAVEWRFSRHLLELAPREVFDQRETVLVAYGVDHILAALEETYYLEYEQSIAEIIELLQTMVAPNDWEDNGGVLAQHKIVGGTMFIKAPKRMHRQINWLLHELAGGAEPDAAGVGRFGGEGGASGVSGGGGGGISGGGGGSVGPAAGGGVSGGTRRPTPGGGGAGRRSTGVGGAR